MAKQNKRPWYNIPNIDDKGYRHCKVETCKKLGPWKTEGSWKVHCNRAHQLADHSLPPLKTDDTSSEEEEEIEENEQVKEWRLKRLQKAAENKEKEKLKEGFVYKGGGH